MNAVRRTAAWVVLGSAVLLPIAMRSQLARACTSPRRPAVVLVTSMLPEDGALLGTFAASCPDCLPEQLEILELVSQERVVGELTTPPEPLGQQRWFVFRPERPWKIGTAYFARLRDQDATAAATFSAVATDREPLTTQAAYAVATDGVDKVECARYSPQSMVGTTCIPVAFFRRSLRRATISLELAGARSSQQAYRIVWTADGETVGESDYAPGLKFEHRFDGMPREVCYEVFGREPLAQNEARISGECFQADREQLGPREERVGDPLHTLQSCVEPPAGFEDAWCDTFEAERRANACLDATKIACESALATCPPVEGTPASADTNDGCTAAPSPARHSPLAGLGAATLIVALRLRTRCRDRLRPPSS